MSINFISYWDIRSTVEDQTIKLPLVSNGNYNFTVDWGDSTSNTITVWNQSQVTHTYSARGFYTITITGICEGWSFNNTGSKNKLVSISDWGTLRLGNNGGYFHGCIRLNSLPVDLDMTGTTNFTNAFNGCTALQSFPLLDTANITTLQNAWKNCGLNTFPLINTSNVTNFESAWENCNFGFNSFPSINTINGTNFTRTWANLNLTSFPLLNTSNGLNFTSTWENCTLLMSFPLLNISNATNLNSTWKNCRSIQTFPLLVTSNVTNFTSTWEDCQGINTAFPSINTSNGNTFNSTWKNCYRMTDFPIIDVTDASSLTSTWENCRKLTYFPPIDTSNIVNFVSTWSGCKALVSFSSIDTSNGAIFANTWKDCGVGRWPNENPSLGWNENSGMTSFPLINTSNATNITGAWDGCIKLTSFPLINTSNVSSFSYAWRNCNNLNSFPLIDTSNGVYFLSTWEGCGLARLPDDPVTDTNGNLFFRPNTGLTTFPNLDFSSGINFNSTWKNCSALTSFPDLDLSNGQYFQSTWEGCFGLTSFPQIDLPNALTLQSAWAYCGPRTYRLNNPTLINKTGLTSFPLISTSNCSIFNNTWQSCSSLTSFPLIDTSNGVTFSNTWQNCSNLTSFPLIDTSNASSFETTWYGCVGLTSFPLIDTSNVNGFTYTWYGCVGLTSFPLIDTSNVNGFTYTWYGCVGLTSFPLIDTSNANDFNSAWQNCSGLTSFPLLNLSNGNIFQNTWKNCTNLKKLPIGFGEFLESLNNGIDCFENVKLTNGTYSRLLAEIESVNSNNNVVFDGGNSKYNDNGLIARNLLTNDHTWIITDGGFESDTISIESDGIILSGLSLLPKFVDEYTSGGSNASGKAFTNEPYNIDNWTGDWQYIPFVNVENRFKVAPTRINNFSSTNVLVVRDYDIDKVYDPNITNNITLGYTESFSYSPPANDPFLRPNYVNLTITSAVVVGNSTHLTLNQNISINWLLLVMFNQEIASRSYIYPYSENENLFYAETNLQPLSALPMILNQDFYISNNSNLSFFWRMRNKAVFSIRLDDVEIFKRHSSNVAYNLPFVGQDVWYNSIIPIRSGQHNIKLYANSLIHPSEGQYPSGLTDFTNKGNGVIVDGIELIPSSNNILKPKPIGSESGWWCPSVDGNLNTSLELEDLSINSNTAVLSNINNTNIVNNNPLGNLNSIQLNGIDESIEIDVESLNVFSNNFSFSIQFKLNSLPLGYYRTIAEFNGISLIYDPTYATPFGVSYTFLGGGGVAFLRTNIELNIWYNVVIVSNPSYVRMYINNSLIDSINPAVAVKFETIYIGGSSFNRSAITVDDIRLFNKSLTEDEIQKIALPPIPFVYNEEFTGGVLLESKTSVAKNPGIVLLGGHATTVFRDIASGGLNASGIGKSPYPYQEIAEGGLVTSGIGKSPYEYIDETSGGILVSITNSPNGKYYEEISSDGVELSGTSIEQKESHQVIISAGLTTNGNSIPNYVFENISQNGSNVSGLSTNNIVIYGNTSQGSLLINGRAINRQFYRSIIVSGGILSNSNGIIAIDYNLNTSGGVHISITSSISTIVDPVIATGGAVLNGNPIVNTMKFYDYDTSGSTQTGGDYHVLLRFLHKVIGQVELDGTVDIEIERRFVRHFSTGLLVKLNSETRVKKDTYQYNTNSGLAINGKSNYEFIYNDRECNGLLKCTVRYPNKYNECFVPLVFKSRKTKAGLDKRTSAILPAISACRQYLFLPPKEKN